MSLADRVEPLLLEHMIAQAELLAHDLRSKLNDSDGVIRLADEIVADLHEKRRLVLEGMMLLPFEALDRDAP